MDSSRCVCEAAAPAQRVTLLRIWSVCVISRRSHSFSAFTLVRVLSMYSSSLHSFHSQLVSEPYSFHF